MAAPTPSPGKYADPAMSSWKGVRIVAGGILVALVIVWAVVQLGRSHDIDYPTKSECAAQHADVARGDRSAVDSDCVGR